MTLLHDAVNDKKLDVRVVERNIARGQLTSNDLEKATKNLPDDAENADYIEIQSLVNDSKLND